MLIKYKNKEVEIEFDSNMDGSLFVSKGFYTESNVDLTDEEMDDITDNYPDLLWEEALDRRIIAAEAMKDR